MNESIKKIVFHKDTGMVVCYNGTTEIEISAKQLFVQTEQDLIEFIEKAGGIAQAITKIKITQKSIELANFNNYKVTIIGLDSGRSVEHCWPVVGRKHWVFCVQTPKGPLWIGNNHVDFSVENVIVQKSRLDEYLSWLEKWALLEENLYVSLREVEGLPLAHNKQTYQFKYGINQWSMKSQKWKYIGKSVKEVQVTRSQVTLLNNQPAAPIWYMSSFISGGGRESFMPIYGVNLDDLNSLFDFE